jgi:YVTN family beta-propeller protein
LSVRGLGLRPSTTMTSAHRRSVLGPALLLFSCAALAACGGGGGGGGGNVVTPPPKTFGPRGSSSIALTSDDKRLLVVNPDADTTSILSTAQDQPIKSCELAVGADPRSVAVTAKGDKAYVANSASGTVSVLSLGSEPRVLKTIPVGTEPRAVLIDDGDRRVFVANSGSNDLSVIDAVADAVTQTVALDAGFGREPRALAYRRDAGGERLFVAMYFAELRPGKTSLDISQDDALEGRVAVFDGADLRLLSTVALGPLANTGFNSNGSVLDLIGTANGQGGTNAPDPANPAQVTFATGAYPNQLAAIGLHPTNGKAYVVSTGASPNGPFGFNVNAQGLVSVFDVATSQEVTGDVTSGVHQRAPLNLNQGLKQDTATAPVLFHSNPTAIAWKPDGSEAWIAIQEADLVVRLTADGAGLPTINAPVQNGGASIARVDLHAVSGGQIAGKAPRGLVIDSTGKRAFVHGYVSRSVSVLDLDARTVIATESTSPLPAPGTPAATVHLGAELFFTGRGPEERMSSEAWGGCIVCHPDGLSDSVTWMFPAGPRQTIALDGMFNRFHTGDQRILNWSALRDENQDFELNTRNVFGGRGLIEDDRAVFIAGGASGGGPTDSAAIVQYHQFLNAVGTTNALAGDAPLPQLLGARRDFGMATLVDGRVVIAGGRAGAGDGALVTGADAVLIFDPKANTVRRGNAVGFTPRHSFGLAAAETPAGPRVYAIGGYAAAAASTAPVAVVEEYDPVANAWRTVAPLPAATAELGVAVNGPLNAGEPVSEVNVLCGNRGSIAAPNVTGALFRYLPDPAGAGAWRTLAFTFTPRRNLGGAAVVRGVFPTHVFAIGGRDAQGAALAKVEAFAATVSQTAPADPTAAVTPLTDLPQARHSFAVGTAINRIYVFGGVDAAGADVATTFEYNPGANPAGGTPGAPGTPSGVWTAKASLATAVRGAQATTPAPVANFLAARSAQRDAEQDAIAEWIKRAVRSAVAPNRGKQDPAILAGAALFAQPGLTGVAGVSCVTCHGGAKWTRSTVDFVGPPSADLARGDEQVLGAELRVTRSQPAVLFDVGTFVPFTAGRLIESRFNPADVGQRINALGAAGFNIPSLLGVAGTAPYFHHGIARTLDEVLSGAHDQNGASPFKGVHRVADAGQRASLIAFLRAIDDATPTFP